MKRRYSRTKYSNIGITTAAACLMILSGTAILSFQKVIHPGTRMIGIAEIILGVIFLCISAFKMYRHKEMLKNYLQIIAEENGTLNSNSLGSLPVPMVIVNVDGTIRWYNDKFSELFENRDMFGSLFESVISDIKWSDILKSAANINKHIEIGDRTFSVVGKMIKDKNDSNSQKEDTYITYVYLIDETEEKRLRLLYNDERTDVAVIGIDNYDEVFQKVDDSEQQRIVSQLRLFINNWAKEGNAVAKRIERDRYFVFFEHRYLKHYIDNKFSILDEVRKLSEDIKQPLSVSIGIGVGGSIYENEASARSALDITLGRGGDQVCIKDDNQYKFYGGRSKEYEKSTRVKTRAVAVALKDFIKNADNVIFMGHEGADYDCFGAAMGLQRAVRALGKTPYIVYDNNSPAIKDLYNDLRNVPEYRRMFVDAEMAIDEITDNTVLVILDTHRPSMLPVEGLLEKVSKIVMIDHHRRSTEFINPCSIVYHEPYASSTCEMVTELIEHMDLGGALTTVETECLYTGILMDTKNFIIKTGARTFEAASYLKRQGLNTAEVKKRFNIKKEDYDHKVDIVKTAVEVVPEIAVAKAYDRIENIRVVASQAADEMLNLNNIRASFVVYPQDNGIGVCARSLGNVNVQLIMESLGGGGHMTVAGAQLKDISIEEAVYQVEIAIHEYLKENK